MILISSTADLQMERNTVENSLSKLDIDGSRFEYWASSPTNPITECLKRIEESDAVVLLLGSRYGSLSDEGISVTHLEYRHAVKINKPVFVYVLKVATREPEQVKFIDEVQKSFFRCKEVENIEQLKNEVKSSFLIEFTRCFRRVHSFPPENISEVVRETTISADTILPDDHESAYKMIERLYNAGDELSLHKLAETCKHKFPESSGIMNFIYMAEVNLAMNGVSIDPDQLVKAIEFWNSGSAKKRWAKDSLLYNQGNAFIALKRFRKAIGCYQESLTKRPDYAPCWKNMGDAYRDMGDIERAHQYYEKAIELEPTLFEAVFSLATLLIQHKNDYEAGLTYLDRISTATLPNRRLGIVYGWKAAAYLKLGKYVEGIVNAEKSLANSPDAQWAWQIAGKLYALARQHDQQGLSTAADFWERFIQKFPHFPEAWAELGFVCWFLKEKNKNATLSLRALYAFNKAALLGLEDDGLVWDRIGHLYEEKENLLDAENAYRRATHINPEQFGYCLGVCLMSLKKYEEALPLLLEAAKQHQPDAQSWIQVAICYLNLERTEEAITAYEKAIELDPETPESWFNLGGIYWNKRDIEKATAIWKEALKRFPKHILCDQVRNRINL